MKLYCVTEYVHYRHNKRRLYLMYYTCQKYMCTHLMQCKYVICVSVVPQSKPMER